MRKFEREIEAYLSDIGITLTDSVKLLEYYIYIEFRFNGKKHRVREVCNRDWFINTTNDIRQDFVNEAILAYLFRLY